MVTLEIGSGLTIGLVLGVVIIVAAMLIWVERRLLGFWQERLGPNRVGWFGLLQVVADMIKIFTKEDWVPRFADRLSFVLAPAIIMTVVLLSFAVIPFAPNIGVVNSNVGVLFVLAMASLGAYSVMLGGLSSDNKYALLGSLRAAAQMISYEVFMGISLLGVVALSGSFNLREIVEDQADTWYVVPQFIGFVIFLIAGIAESHRLPFDIPEAEQEICSGYHTEYSGMKFGMFFVAEYIGLVLVSSLITVLFFGGWLGPSFLPPIFWFVLKASLFIAFFILLRAAIPRPRYDQLMNYGWLFLLPVSLINLLVTGFIILSNQ
ncbi:MAG: NADH-quinone oxidoreductase subunit NuoH [Gammaproteobacteria bacterium]|jgi:NADH-quinone oxidoreductase subunit H|nr:NADH-quinone oxidoreductase subunit NuoH [Gammaproteobacteria bacterium]HAC86902.1 NADH-quinone oxidoreductase subunit NuoH [Gammaproteobacteria bacterium]HAD72249.1 NADH-quinone oxidoreductase subunit NuoH [Gammaproteobacteria bacterium]|tara:strand:+ start:10083 stop:11042 length:960 start_codon:yes stop_codon:yes gene_type:complete